MPSSEAPAPSSSRLVRSAGLIGVATITSRVLGLVRDQTLAFLFGAGSAMDAFNVAFRIPNLVRDLFAEGAMSSAFVPTFTRYLTRKGKDEAWILGNHVLNGLIVVTGLIAVGGILCAGPLVLLFASEFAEVEGKLELTVLMTRILFPFLVLVAVAVAFMGMLNSLQRFFVPALSPAMFNVAIILAGVAIVPWMPDLGLEPVTGIAIGALIGGLGQVVLQWPFLRRQGFRYRPILDPRHEGLRQVLRLMVPGTIGLAAVQVNLLVNTILATGEGTGAVSWLNFAFRLMYLPIGLLGVSVATAALPQISRSAAAEDPAALRRDVAHALRLVLVLNVPAMVGLMVLATPIVRLIFERGSFTAADTDATAAALLCYAPGLLGYSSVKVAAPSFYALGESRTPVAVSMISIVVAIVLNVTLVQVMGFRGLALGTGLAALTNATLLVTLLRRRLGGLEAGTIGSAVGKVSAASVVMGVAAWGTELGLHGVIAGTSAVVQLLRVGAAIGVGVLVLTVMARVLGIDEWNEAVSMVLRRFRRPKKGPGPFSDSREM